MPAVDDVVVVTWVVETRERGSLPFEHGLESGDADAVLVGGGGALWAVGALRKKGKFVLFKVAWSDEYIIVKTKIPIYILFYLPNLDLGASISSLGQHIQNNK